MKISGIFIVIVMATAPTMVSAQAPQVPHKMQFAGMTLTIRDDARREIQKDVDALTLSPKHFNIKAERAKTYFPIIEKILEEEQVPVDFKYLVLQESSLVADAVSPSNAVGFWQFKDYTALEMGLRVDRQIDERMNIVSATRGAARYIKKNNFNFNNWLYALQSYQMGAGAVMQAYPDTQNGARHMEITSKTYWYVKKFLAHKVAFEMVSGPGQLQVITLENKTKKSLADLAREISVDELALRDYNKWLKSGVIPEDKVYAVLVPVKGNINPVKPQIEVVSPSNEIMKTTTVGVAVAAMSTRKAGYKINDLPTLVALPGENAASLAARGGVDVNDFVKWNDISVDDSLKVDQPYFLAKKRTRAVEAYHKVLIGEDLWIVSQNYGVQIRKLKKYNRLQAGYRIKPGETLWLSSKRPKDSSAAPIPAEVAEIDDKSSFNWSADPKTDKPIHNVAADKPETPLRQMRVEPLPTQVDTLKILQTVPDVVKTNLVVKDSVISVRVRKTDHIVSAGETLYSIAHENNVGVMDLVNWNSLNLQDGIKPGQVLKLSESQPVNVSPDLSSVPVEIIHEVKLNDTLYSIARKYGVTIKELMEWNEKKDFTVNTGEKLKIIRK